MIQQFPLHEQQACRRFSNFIIDWGCLYCARLFTLSKTFPEGILIQIIMAFEIVEIGIINDILRTSWHVLENSYRTMVMYIIICASLPHVRLLYLVLKLLQCIENVVLYKVGIHTNVMKESTACTHITLY